MKVLWKITCKDGTKKEVTTDESSKPGIIVVGGMRVETLDSVTTPTTGKAGGQEVIIWAKEV